MKPLLIAILVLVLLVGVGRSVFIFLNAEKLEPIAVSRAHESAAPARALPADAIVVTITDALKPVAPFALRPDPSAAGRVALVLPSGAHTRHLSGRATLECAVPEAGEWNAWVHARWRDTCGNSVTLKIGDTHEKLVGEDALYGCWHWVDAGPYKLSSGKTPLLLIEHEDGIAIDQLLLTRDRKYMPVGAIASGVEAREIRRFADDFSRSPGHGLENWEAVSGKWEIAFSFDPNRLPNQYALTGRAAATADTPSAAKASGSDSVAGEALTLIKGPAWYGCRLSYSFLPETPGQYGVVLDRSADGRQSLRVCLNVNASVSTVTLSTQSGAPPAKPGQSVVCAIYPAGATVAGAIVAATGALRLNQWHQVVVERWAWLTNIFVDGKLLLANDAAAPAAGDIGFFVASGSAVFDDVEVDEIPWLADDGGDLRMDWTPASNAQWFRGENRNAPLIKPLVGHSGRLVAPTLDLPLRQVLIQQSAGVGRTGVTLGCGDFQQDASGDSSCIVLNGVAPGPLWIQPKGPGACRIERVALRFGVPPLPKKHVVGRYDFTQSSIPDPSDYLDFTPEEYAQMARSGDAQKLERRAKFMRVIGEYGQDISPWIPVNGNWWQSNGTLSASGPAVLAHAEECIGDMEMRFRVRLHEPRSSAQLGFYVGTEKNDLRVSLLREKAENIKRENSALVLDVADGNWHDVVVQISGSAVSAALDATAARSASYTRGDGGRIELRVPAGRVEFDDVLIETPKSDAAGAVYSFAQRETDWWREGRDAAWIDHGGISCVLASSWISLAAPHGGGVLWNKRSFGPDVLVNFAVEENTDWFGWDQPESHIHYPCANIVVLLTKDPPGGDPRVAQGYRLELNTLDHSVSALYRNGAEVVRVPQDGNFPMRFVGGHAPNFPRVQHVTFVKRGSLVRATLNGKEIVRFEDPQPLDVRNVSLGGYETHINFSRIQIRTPNSEQRTSNGERGF